MAELTTKEAITRFKESEKRAHILVNDPEGAGSYLTDTSPAKAVETYPHFITRITNTANGIVAQAQGAADRAEVSANESAQTIVRVTQEGSTQIQRVREEGQKYIEGAEQQANRAETEADRARNYADAAGLGSFAHNIRRVAVLDESVPWGSILNLPAAYYPGRSILLLSINGIVCSPKNGNGTIDPDLHQYEEIGDDPDTLSESIRVFFDVDAGSTIDCWVVASNQDRSALSTDASQQTLSTNAATDTVYTVSEYIVGQRSLTVFVNGILAPTGATIDDGFYKELGEAGQLSNTIQVFDSLPAGTELATTSLVRRQ